MLKCGLHGGLAAAISGSLWLQGCGKRQSVDKRPNVIFILTDTLRADRMGLYGYHRDTTATIDAIAAEGVTFDRVIAQAPWTQPSVASLFCSRYPGVHKVLDYGLAEAMHWDRAQKMPVFGDSFTTLVEVLRDNGYETAGFIANFLASGYYGFDQGFNLYADLRSRNSLLPVAGDVLNNDLRTWMPRRNSDKPLFLYMHYNDVHGPYYARPEFYEPFFAQVRQMPNKRKLSKTQKEALGYLAKRRAAKIIAKYEELSNYQEFWSAFYDAGVREQDRHIADLTAYLKEMGLWDDAYVVIAADHGEELLEHGLWSHGFSVYHTELHVPLILRWPKVLPAGRRVGGTVRLLDLMPTLLEQLQLPVIAGMQGRSLMPDIAGNPPSQPVPAFSEGVKWKPEDKSLYLGDWKLIVKANRKIHLLYNVTDDPKEQNNLYGQYPAKAKELAGLLLEQMNSNKQLASETKAQQVPITPEQYEQLKSLGYVR